MDGNYFQPRRHGKFFRNNLSRPDLVDYAFEKLPDEMGKENAAIALVLNSKLLRGQHIKCVPKTFMRELFDKHGGYDGWIKRLDRSVKKQSTIRLKKTISVEAVKTSTTSQEDSDLQCRICLSDNSDSLFYPCKHLCACAKCASEIMNRTRKCPICRVDVTYCEKVYVS